VTTHLNVEMKARCPDPEGTLRRLAALGAREQGVDHQVDTYFHAPSGRLKLRQGGIENYLIHYERADEAGPKESVVSLHAVASEESPGLRDLLTKALGVMVVVDKQRHILWIDNVKFHVDSVQGLGSFVEIEAIDRIGEIGRDRLLEQCAGYVGLLKIDVSELEPRSYSDLMKSVTEVVVATGQQPAR
jgi:adenylate cyclase class 2